MSKERAETHVSHVSCMLCFYVWNQYFKCQSGNSHNFSTIQESLGCPAVVSRDHEVCLAAEHAERRRSPSTTEVGDAAAKGAKSIKWKNPQQDFFDDCSKSVLNLICPTTPRSDVNWLSGIPPAPTIHCAKKHLEVIWKGYSWCVADSIVAGAAVPLSLSASFVAQACLIKILFEEAATS